jgi:ribosomal protein S3
MYAKLCSLEILSSYIKDLTIGDLLSVEVSIANPLDWHHFYERISIIKERQKTFFAVVTKEGERVVGEGEVNSIERWSNAGTFGFKIKVNVTKQKSSTDRRIKAGRIRNAIERRGELSMAIHSAISEII